MKAVLGCLLTIAASALAQPVPEPRLVDLLSDDLMRLTFLSGMPDDGVVVDPRQLAPKDLAALKAAVKGRTSELNDIMLSFAAHATERYGKPVVPWSLAYVLGSTLAGKNLPEDSAKLLAVSILSSLDSAVACHESSRPQCLENSAQFHVSVTSTHHTLVALGISRPNARIVMENLIFAGDLIVHPRGPYFARCNQPPAN